MTQTIWKFSLDMNDRLSIDLPVGSEILTVQMQRGSAHLWAKVDAEAPIDRRFLRWVGTGRPVDFDGLYIGTVQLAEESLVFHLFEEVGPGR